MSEWKTPKGTTLYLLDLRGKPYLPVAERLIWFREEHPEWTITTEFLRLEDKYSIAKATISDANGTVKATAHKREDEKHFADFMEKSEAGAIGRALAYCGYGTQFCSDELDEGERIVDAPANKPKPQEKKQSEGLSESMQTCGDYVVKFGSANAKGKKLSELGHAKVSEMLAWVKTKAKQEFRESQLALEFVFWAETFLKQKGAEDDLDAALAKEPNNDWQNEDFDGVKK